MGSSRLLAIAAIVGVAVLGGCSADVPAANTLPDGEYEGVSQKEADGSYGTVNFTISGGKVTKANFLVKDADGTPHDEDYGLGTDGKAHDPIFYQRAQDAIKHEKSYVQKFQETSDQNQVERIAGGSLSHRLFMQAVEDAVLNAGAEK
ncbi:MULTISPECIES: FMN-binding protein [Trueperella]|uniref:FMN-binding protein n=1 Tax=Trueperella bernardiae TaxID=59561 RepID=A0AAW6ZLJ5_9ACTO|nr:MULTISPECIES: FMN-binding protein [Trueperella]MDK8351745.1 FMN-binding protein [Gleimia europaea]MCM3907586.1 FMN-binding protein [Trueperella bernardiae]MDK8534382.1 FMN-binding protein [Gleimia europaea]MDK8602771.1 FMN-binding protein [Trueperella bernardiae]MDV6238731.1 FMN-binding protein [Trueperella bernardiae]